MRHGLAAAFVLTAIAGSAQADLYMWCAVTAQSSAGTATWTSTATPTFDANGNAVWHWEPSGGRWLNDPTTTGQVGMINWLHTEYVADPVVNLNFAVTAGAVPTIFTITSGLLGFAPINGEARATASVTLTESDENTASITGNLPGNALYVANFGALPGGVPFTFLLGNDFVGVPTTGSTQNGATPGVGYLPVGIVSSMQSQFSFTLSPNDQASGTSSFVVRLIPTPGAAALLGLGTLMAGRRRR